MEEPQDVHTDENRALPEKKPKRTVKTPNQIAALENFYNEHKYPTEAMKLELAESIGLTEKQVSGWFCHRRLKDKKSPNDEAQTHEKHDWSSGVIQDRGSGLRQDSCGSTKQGDNKHYDPREVESRRFTTESLLPIEPRFDHGRQYNNIMDDYDDDTSSGSSSPLKDNFHPQNVDLAGSLTSNYPTYIDIKNVKSRTGQSGYLKVKGQVEHAAITSVKRKLGRHYREDGPPLGIEFESLPPDAFENLVNAPVSQSFYVGDPTTFHPLPNVSKVYDRYNSKSYHPHDSGLETRNVSKQYEKHSNSQYTQTPPFSKHRQSLSGRIIQMGVDDDDSASVDDFSERLETRVKHTPGVRRPDFISSHHPISYRKIIDGKEAETYPRTNNSGHPKVNYRDHIEPMTCDLSVKPSEFEELEDRGRHRKTFKDVDFNGDRGGIDEYSNLGSTKSHAGNEMRITKRSREEFSHQVYPRKEVMVGFPSRTNMTKRSGAHMSASFSDDETAETSSAD